MIQGARDGGDDGERLVYGHPVGYRSRNRWSGIGPVDERRGDPQLVVVLAAIVHGEDVRVGQSCGKVSFLDEPITELPVIEDVGSQHLHGIEPWQAQVLGEIDLAHASGSEESDDRIARESITCAQRHGRRAYAWPLRSCALPADYLCDALEGAVHDGRELSAITLSPPLRSEETSLGAPVGSDTRSRPMPQSRSV